MTTAAASYEHASRAPKGWNIALWIAQLTLGVLFAMGGFMKATVALDELARTMVWVPALPPGLVRFIGIAEFAGALGVVLPALTRVAPKLTPLAAAGLLAIMLLAALFHVPRGEFSAIPMNLALGGIAAFIAWGRYRKAPIRPR